MTKRRWIRMIDAGASGHEDAVILMPEDGEYVRAIGRLEALGPQGPLGPEVLDEVFLHLFAYELLERMRELDRTEAKVVLPFWPSSIFEAAGLVSHGAQEIEALFPEAEETHYVPREEESIVAAAKRVMGGLRFDPALYLDSVERMATAKGWKIVEDE